MPLKIAFIGYNNRLTQQALQQFAIDNHEQVYKYDKQSGLVLLWDGTVIEAITSSKSCLDGKRYDQTILADGERLAILQKRAHEIAWLRHTMQYNGVPEEWQFQWYNMDAQLQEREKSLEE